MKNNLIYNGDSGKLVDTDLSASDELIKKNILSQIREIRSRLAALESTVNKL